MLVDDFALDIRLCYQPTHSQSTYAFAIDLRIRNRPTLLAFDVRLSPPTSASRSRPTGYATHSRRRPSTAFDRPAQDHVLVKSLSKIMSSSPTHAFTLIKDRGLVPVEGVLFRVEGARGKHNARRRFLGELPSSRTSVALLIRIVQARSCSRTTITASCAASTSVGRSTGRNGLSVAGSPRLPPPA